ncbi:hypothetical protein B0H10DRAFT_632304 [Mycena sp. CBHHK59/15]|nr:hypothetical protein B0H10DRAFT_632304 [Mycena sp. CBHHK59/15]
MFLFALTYGSFGDIVETAKLAKQIIDVLHGTGVSIERQEVISTLQVMAQYMSMVSTIEVDASSPNVQFLATKLAAEVALCRALMDKFCARIKLLDGFIGRIWMAVQEEKELASWKTQVSERRDALYLLLVLLYGERSVDQLGRVGSQVQYVGSRVDSIEAQGRLVMSRVGDMMNRMSLHDISDPVFVVMNPGFLRDPQMGGRYVERGDYSLVSAEGLT